MEQIALGGGKEEEEEDDDDGVTRFSSLLSFARWAMLSCRFRKKRNRKGSSSFLPA